MAATEAQKRAKKKYAAKQKRLYVELNDEQRKWIDETAEKYGLSIKELVLKSIENYAKEKDPE